MNHSSLLSSLDALEVDRQPAEVHGLLCGLLCTCTHERAKSLWFSVVLDEYSGDPSRLREKGESLKSLDTFFYESVEQLNDVELGFSLLVEEDLASVHEHLLQLAYWCSGFGLGFGMGERATAKQKLPADTEELLTDFQAIANYENVQQSTSSDVDDGDLADDEESDVVEIEEFIRVGVLLINEEMNPAAKTDNPGQADSGASTTEGRTLH